MGMFNKLAKKMSGENDIQNGPLGRGLILGFELTGMSIEVNGVESRVCRFQVQVMLDDTEPYIATCKQRLAVWDIGRIQPGATVAAVRVDPNDPQRIAIDFTVEPPAVRGVRGQGASAAQILATGAPGVAVLQQFQDMSMTNPEGVPIYAFQMVVTAAGGQPYVCQVGNPMPPAALPLLFPGSKVPVKIGAGGPNEVVIDWAAALASA